MFLGCWVGDFFVLLFLLCVGAGVPAHPPWLAHADVLILWPRHFAAVFNIHSSIFSVAFMPHLDDGASKDWATGARRGSLVFSSAALQRPRLAANSFPFAKSMATGLRVKVPAKQPASEEVPGQLILVRVVWRKRASFTSNDSQDSTAPWCPPSRWAPSSRRCTTMPSSSPSLWRATATLRRWSWYVSCEGP